MDVHHYRECSWRPGEGAGKSGTGVVGSGEPLGVGAGK